jgi:hypothetical protein
MVDDLIPNGLDFGPVKGGLQTYLVLTLLLPPLREIKLYYYLTSLSLNTP